MRGGPFTDSERSDLLNYCATDVIALDRLARKMPFIGTDINHALLRGEFMRSAACVEHRGTPLDTQKLSDINTYWPQIKNRLIFEVDKSYNVYEKFVFKAKNFEKYLTENNIPWPRTEKGNLELDEDTFKEMSLIYPKLISLKELRALINTLKLNKLSVGKDGRNRLVARNNLTLKSVAYLNNVF